MISGDFRAANDPQENDKPKPFSIRLTKAERAYLERKAGRRPLGAYIRSKLLEGQAAARKQTVSSNVDLVATAKLLAALGDSRLSQNVARLSALAASGSLIVSDEIERDLRCAALAIVEIKCELVRALGVRSSSSRTKVSED